MEQRFDQRGGLCEVGAGNVIVTSDVIDPDYLAYWVELGFDLPHMINLARKEEENHLSLSELLLARPLAIQEIQRFINGREAQLEFFWIDEPEENLVGALGIPAFCGIEFARAFTSKVKFRRLAKGLGLPLAEGAICSSFDEIKAFALQAIERGISVTVKGELGTGGVDGGCMETVHSQAELMSKIPDLVATLGGEFVVEELLEGPITEISIHWVITAEGKTENVRIAGQLSENCGYAGAYWPTMMSKEEEVAIAKRVSEELGPSVVKFGGRGCFCCDVIVSPREHWMDFNPRKGAIRYILEMLRRLKCSCKESDDQPLVPFWHEQLKLNSNPDDPGERKAFSQIREILDPLLDHNRTSFVIITNPGLIETRHFDLTGVGPTRDAAQNVCQVARRRLIEALT